MTIRILIVDDSITQQRVAGLLLQKGLKDVAITYADNGKRAIEVLAAGLPDLIVTDLQMPEMNGLELVEHIKSGGYGVPVILMTSFGNEEIAVRALQSGAASYVPKQVLGKYLAETAGNVLSLSRGNKNRQRVLSTLSTIESRFVLENDTSLVGPLIAYLQEQASIMQLFNDSQLTRIAVALHEALTNAIYHGNLELDSDLRQHDENVFYTLGDERRDQLPYSTRRVSLVATLSSEQVQFIVGDSGPGFDPKCTLDPTEEVNMERIGGRGLLLIRSFMDRVTHNPQGNEITMIKFTSAAKSL